MRFNIVVLLCVLLFSLIAEAKYKRKLLTVYKEATKGLSKEEKKLIFRKFGRAMKGFGRKIARTAKKAGRAIKKGVKAAAKVALSPQVAGVVGMFNPAAGALLQTAGALVNGGGQQEAAQ
eukprot:TRINITY_DN1031_c0_g1_i8.p1 TRINITY_DN1031_c0_g1~~TRINITY_DN1031_c0_g1_i8.p1  ORF type:complete len:120 (+),score=23.53 TRINITY_DN1031_c0_g1_i8:251-610(+)